MLISDFIDWLKDYMKEADKYNYSEELIEQDIRIHLYLLLDTWCEGCDKCTQEDEDEDEDYDY